MQDPIQQTGARTPSEGRRNLAWTALAAVSTLFLALVVIGSVGDAVAGEWVNLLAIPVALIVWFWIAGGAWRRTTWGASEAE